MKTGGRYRFVSTFDCTLFSYIAHCNILDFGFSILVEELAQATITIAQHEAAENSPLRMENWVS